MIAATEHESPDTTNSGADFRTLLRNRAFLFLWMAQLFSQLAQQMINYALVRQVADLTEASSTAIAAIIICFTVPGVLFSIVAGVFVERRSKRSILVVTNASRAVAVLFYLLTVLFPSLNVGYILPILFVNTLIFSSISQFFAPAEASMIPLLVKPEDRVNANALFNLTLTASQLLGFVLLGPLLLPFIGYTGFYIVLSSLFAVCTLLTWLIPRVEGNVAQAVAADPASGELSAKLREAGADLKEGWQFIRADAALVIAIIYWSVAIAIFMMLATIGQKFLQDVLHINPEHLYFILIPSGLGLVVGVAVVGRLSTVSNRTHMINYALLVAGAALLALSLIHDLLRIAADLIGQAAPPTIVSQVIIGALGFVLGVCNSFITVPAQTVLQERAPQEIRARVFAAFYTVSNAILIVPLLIAGALADLIGVLPTVVGMAVLILALALGGIFYRRRYPEALLDAPAETASSG